MGSSSNTRVGCVVGAMRRFAPGVQHVSMRRLGSTSVIKRIVTTFTSVGVSPIVIVSGEDDGELEHELAMYPVFFIHLPEDGDIEPVDGVKAGLHFLKNRCDRALFIPADVPFSSPVTVRQLLEVDAVAAAPIYRGQIGYPVLLSSQIFEGVLSYMGEGRLKDAVESVGANLELMETDDAGVATTLDAGAFDEDLLASHTNNLLHPFLRVRLGRESPFMGGRVQMLLEMIEGTGSVRGACDHIQLSYSKAWKMLNELEGGLGYKVVQRKHGGSRGGKTHLTPEGRDFLARFAEYTESVRLHAEEEFMRLFAKECS